MTNIISKLFGGGHSSQADLMKGLSEALSSGQGGVAGLMEKFDVAGLGDKARSWVGDGPNESVSGDEVRQALGDQDMAKIAEKAHMSTDQASNELASMLPDTVNKLTPDGKIPDRNELQEMLKKLPGL